MAAQEGPVPVRLTWAEAISVLVQAEMGDLGMGGAATSAADKLRQAMMAGRLDPGGEVEIGCTEDEAAFLAQASRYCQE